MRACLVGRLLAVPAGAANAAGSQALTEAPPLPDPDGTHAALVLLQRLLRGRAVQSQMYAGKESRLQLIRELRLGLEGTGGELVMVLTICQLTSCIQHSDSVPTGFLQMPSATASKNPAGICEYAYSLCVMATSASLQAQGLNCNKR